MKTSVANDLLETLMAHRESFVGMAAKFANKASPKTLNRSIGIVLVAIGVSVLGVNIFGR